MKTALLIIEIWFGGSIGLAMLWSAFVQIRQALTRVRSRDAKVTPIRARNEAEDEGFEPWMAHVRMGTVPDPPGWGDDPMTWPEFEPDAEHWAN